MVAYCLKTKFFHKNTKMPSRRDIPPILSLAANGLLRRDMLAGEVDDETSALYPSMPHPNVADESSPQLEGGKLRLKKLLKNRHDIGRALSLASKGVNLLPVPGSNYLAMGLDTAGDLLQGSGVIGRAKRQAASIARKARELDVEDALDRAQGVAAAVGSKRAQKVIGKARDIHSAIRKPLVGEGLMEDLKAAKKYVNKKRVKKVLDQAESVAHALGQEKAAKMVVSARRAAQKAGIAGEGLYLAGERGRGLYNAGVRGGRMRKLDM